MLLNVALLIVPLSLAELALVILYLLNNIGKQLQAHTPKAAGWLSESILCKMQGSSEISKEGQENLLL